MAKLNILAVILAFIFIFYDHVEAIRFRYSYYSYYTYYTYYYYSGYSTYLSPADKGMIAGIVIGVVVLCFIIMGCIYYCRSKRSGTSGTVITTGQGNYPPPVYPAMPMTTATSGAPYSQPPPPYQPPGGGTTDFQNVDSRSKTNLVHNEVAPS